MKRFTDKIKIVESGCWEWQAGLKSKKEGYGVFRFRGKAMLSHRVSYILFKEEISDHILVCHRCDNPLCVNPQHLFLGTKQDNYDDAKSKGRIVISPNSHLKKHPSSSAYKRGCRCIDCITINRNRVNNYRRRTKL